MAKPPKRMWEKLSGHHTHRVVFAALVALCLALPACDRERIDLDNGYNLLLIGSEPLLHAPGTLELHHGESGRDKLIGVCIVGEPAITNNATVFNCGLSNEDRWKGYPCIMAYMPPGPPVEITEPILRFYCARTRRNYDYQKKRYSFDSPKFTNHALSVAGIRTWGGHGDFTIDVSIPLKELSNMVEEVQSKGATNKYGKMIYKMEP